MHLTLSLLLIFGLTATDAKEPTRREEQCRFQWMDQGTWTDREERLTAECLVNRWAIPGGMDQLSRVLQCESGWNRLAYNPSGPYVGLAQHAWTSWRSRFTAYKPSWWSLRPSWRNSRTMLVITVRMVRDVGWTPWTCA